MIIAYIYDRQGNNIAQIEEILSFSCSIKLNEVSTGEMSIPNTQVSGLYGILKENNRISVFRKIGMDEKLLIEGYIRGYEATITHLSIKIEDKLSILEDKLTYSDIVHFDTVDKLLKRILDEVNGREDTLLRLDCGITEMISKKFSKGEIVLNMIKDIRQNMYEFTIRDNKLIFKRNIGTDRTIGDDYVEFVWDYLDPTSNNIRNAKVTADIKLMANCTIGKNESNKEEYQDNDSIGEFGRIERPIVNNGSIEQSAEGFVTERKESIREYDIEPVSSDFRSCDIGDSVKVRINTGNDLMYYDGVMKITEKIYTAGELDQVIIKVSHGVVKTKRISEEIKELKQRTMKIEYNQ